MNKRQLLVLLPILGVLSCALYAVGMVTKGQRNTFSCQSNLKQVGLGFMQYMRDYDEKNVLSGNWKPALFPYLKSHQIFECPSDNEYALNLHGSGIDLGVINNPTITPLVFDSTSTQPNAADFGTSYPQDGAHSIWKRGRGTNVLFFDGHVKWMQQKPVFKVLTPPIPSQKPKMKPKAQPKAARAR